MTSTAIAEKAASDAVETLMQDPASEPGRELLRTSIVWLRDNLEPSDHQPCEHSDILPCIWCGELPNDRHEIHHVNDCAMLIYLGHRYSSLDVMWRVVEVLRIRQYRELTG